MRIRLARQPISGFAIGVFSVIFYVHSGGEKTR